MAATSKFNARSFAKYQFVHLSEEDFTDDGNRFAVYLHVPSGIKVSYSRGNWGGFTEYFISPRDFSDGLNYHDYSNLEAYKNSDKYNGCCEVDLEDLQQILFKLADAIEARKAELEDKEYDLSPVVARLMKEKAYIKETIAAAKSVDVWSQNLNERGYKRVMDAMHGVERELCKVEDLLSRPVESFSTKELSELTYREKEYGYVVTKLDGYYLNNLHQYAEGMFESYYYNK